MSRTKGMRLIVYDMADVVRWAAAQHARHISDFRYRNINGRESVSFRMIPDYGIQVGATQIIVVCHARGRALSRARHLIRRGSERALNSPARFIGRIAEWWRSPAAPPAPPSAEIYPFPMARRHG